MYVCVCVCVSVCVRKTRFGGLIDRGFQKRLWKRKWYYKCSVVTRSYEKKTTECSVLLLISIFYFHFCFFVCLFFVFTNRGIPSTSFPDRPRQRWLQSWAISKLPGNLWRGSSSLVPSRLYQVNIASTPAESVWCVARFLLLTDQLDLSRAVTQRVWSVACCLLRSQMETQRLEYVACCLRYLH